MSLSQFSQYSELEVQGAMRPSFQLLQRAGALQAPRALQALLGAFGPQQGYNVQTLKERKKMKITKIAVMPKIIPSFWALRDGHLDTFNIKICPLFQILQIEIPDFQNLLCSISRSTKCISIGLYNLKTPQQISFKSFQISYLMSQKLMVHV